MRSPCKENEELISIVNAAALADMPRFMEVCFGPDGYRYDATEEVWIGHDVGFVGPGTCYFIVYPDGKWVRVVLAREHAQ